jgi:pimeloyl-ACP methyl ester carboxylesterase
MARGRTAKRIALALFIALATTIATGALYRSYRRSELAAGLEIASGRGIDEGHFIEAGGIEQWITIRGVDRNNPVILFVHGGPAEILSFVPAATQGLEQDFTVVHWDQRGAGRTYARNPKPPADLTLEQMTADGVEVAAWLAQHLAQPRVILVGHSWGSLLAEHMVFARPELFSVYVGTGQFVSWTALTNEQYAYSLRRAEAENDADTLAALRTVGGPPFDDATRYREFRSVMRRHYGPADLGFSERQVGDLLTSPRASLGDIWNALQGARASVAALTSTITDADVTRLGYDFPIPFAIVQGADDRISPTALAADYFSRVRAPAKVLVRIPNAGHYSFATHAAEFRRGLVTDVLPLIATARQD